MQKLDKLLIKYILFIAVVVLFVLKYEEVFGWLGILWLIISPVVIGAVIAYILNILMVKFERWYFPNVQNVFVKKSRRPISILLSMLVILLVIFLVFGLVVPQVVTVVATVIENIPAMFAGIQEWSTDYERLFPEAAALMDQFDIDWAATVKNAVSFVNNLTTSILETTLSTVGSVASIIINLVLSIIVSIYMLMSKEKLAHQFDRMIKVYLKPRQYEKFQYVVSQFDESFRNYITGVVAEAFILGAMVTIGMWIFRFPYAAMIGALTGFFAIIPMLGAYFSAVIGALLIAVESPLQALVFLGFIVVVQQIENNIIYPKVVGGSIGLPGLFVLVAVTIGGGLMGIPGMIISVPLASALYKLLKNDVKQREKAKSFQTDKTDQTGDLEYIKQYIKDFKDQNMT